MLKVIKANNRMIKSKTKKDFKSLDNLEWHPEQFDSSIRGSEFQSKEMYDNPAKRVKISIKGVKMGTIQNNYVHELHRELQSKIDNNTINGNRKQQTVFMNQLVQAEAPDVDIKGKELTAHYADVKGY